MGIFRDLAAGSTVGEAMRRFYSSDDSLSRRSRMCLFGDPRVRAMPPGSRLALPPRTPPATPSAGSKRLDGGSPGIFRTRCTLLIRILQAVEQKGKEPDVKAAAELAMKSVGRALADPRQEVVLEAQQSTLRCLLRAQEAWNYLIRAGLPPRATGARHACSACGEDVHVFLWPSTVEESFARRQGHCNRCGIVYDVEENSQHTPDFDIVAGRLHLPGTLVGADAYAGLTLRNWRRESVSQELFPTSGAASDVSELAGGFNLAHVIVLREMELVFIRKAFEEERPTLSR
jgi:hypothetical protein